MLLRVQIYEHLKEKSGSFKPGIESVEGTVKTVVGPVISRIDFAPDEYLKFVDGKVRGTCRRPPISLTFQPPNCVQSHDMSEQQACGCFNSVDGMASSSGCAGPATPHGGLL